MTEEEENKFVKGIPTLKLVELDPECEINMSYPLPNLKWDELYVVLGEVQDSRHYVLACYSLESPRILPGMYELYRFREGTTVGFTFIMPDDFEDFEDNAPEA